MRKPSLLIVVVCFISIPILNAQFNQGKFLLGVSSSSDLYSLMSMYDNGSQHIVNLGFSTFKYKSDSDEDDSEKLRNFNITPKVGYFLGNNLVAGFNINFRVAAIG